MNFEELRSLHDHWDGEYAPRPNADAICRAELLVTKAKMLNLVPCSVDADVIGGVAVSFWRAPFMVWIALMNNGHDSIVVTHHGTGGSISTSPFNGDVERICHALGIA